MEFCDDGDLFQKISQHLQNKTKFDEQYVWRVIFEVVSGLKALHDLKILHRDMKSANIFLNKVVGISALSLTGQELAYPLLFVLILIRVARGVRIDSAGRQPQANVMLAFLAIEIAAVGGSDCGLCGAILSYANCSAHTQAKTDEINANAKMLCRLLIA